LWNSRQSGYDFPELGVDSVDEQECKKLNFEAFQDFV
jgi:hypothetical protein